MLITGFLHVPIDGVYTLTLATDTGAVLRLHEATVIDADFGYTGGKEISESIRLKAGKHPIRLYYVHHAGRVPQLDMQWNGPSIESQPIPASAFSSSE